MVDIDTTDMDKILAKGAYKKPISYNGQVYADCMTLCEDLKIDFLTFIRHLRDNNGKLTAEVIEETRKETNLTDGLSNLIETVLSKKLDNKVYVSIYRIIEDDFFFLDITLGANFPFVYKPNPKEEITDHLETILNLKKSLLKDTDYSYISYVGLKRQELEEMYTTLKLYGIEEAVHDEY